MRLAVISGKGGTGKSGTAVSLALLAAERRLRVTLVDADVEAPDADLLLRVVWQPETRVWLPIPHVQADRCNHCGACSDFCSFHALVNTPKLLLVFPELCHSCGGCFRVCPQHALVPESNPIGIWRSGEAEAGFRLIQGRLDVGQTATPALLRELLSQISPSPEMLTIIDGPPGAACPLQTVLRFADRVLLVAEPTRFGIHDLEVVIKVLRDHRLPVSVLLNRTLNDETGFATWCQEQDLPLWGSIPEDSTIARATATGTPLAYTDERARKTLDTVLTLLTTSDQAREHQ